MQQQKKRRLLELVFGILGIYILYFLAGVFHESMMKEPYINRFTGLGEYFTSSLALTFVPYLFGWILSTGINWFTIPSSEAIAIPEFSAAQCGAIVAISTVTYNIAIFKTNFPVVVMVKSCNILSVLIVGVFFSRVKSTALKLDKKKLIAGLLITAGIILFKIGDLNLTKNSKNTQIMGVILLLISLVADGFLPDFQARIKEVYKPKPTEMMASVNKWVAILTLLCLIANQELIQSFQFITFHDKFGFHLVAMSVLSALGQVLVYRMIREFKQHIVPFVITTRKLGTVILSIIFFGHPFNVIEVSAVALVFTVVVYQFKTELETKPKQPQQQLHEINDSIAIDSNEKGSINSDDQVILARDK